MTDLIVQRTVEEFLKDFKPTYNAIMPLFLGEGRSKQYEVEDGQVTLKRVKVQGDVRGKVFGSKDTEMTRIQAAPTSNGFKKYYYAAQYTQSTLQSRDQVEQVNAQILDEHNKHNDIIFVTGDGAADGSVVNNGLLFSADPNYTKKASDEIATGNTGSHELYELLATDLETSNVNDGQKLVLFYGATVASRTNALFTGTDKPVIATLKEAFEDVSFAKMPASIVPAGQQGYLVINLDQITTHYSLLPGIRKQGENAEKEYFWWNFMLGSSMVELNLPGAISRQPLTFAT